MYLTCWKFAVEGYEDATSVPYGYLLVDLKPDQDERYRLRTNVFPGEMQPVYVRKQSYWHVGQTMGGHLCYGEWIRCRLFRELNVICDKWTTYDRQTD